MQNSSGIILKDFPEEPYWDNYVKLIFIYCFNSNESMQASSRGLLLQYSKMSQKTPFYLSANIDLYVVLTG